MNRFNTIACQLGVKWLCANIPAFFVACNKVNKEVPLGYYGKYIQPLAEIFDQPKRATIINPFKIELLSYPAGIEYELGFYHAKANYLLVERHFEGALPGLHCIIFLIKYATHKGICSYIRCLITTSGCLTVDVGYWSIRK